MAFLSFDVDVRLASEAWFSSLGDIDPGHFLELPIYDFSKATSSVGVFNQSYP